MDSYALGKDIQDIKTRLGAIEQKLDGSNQPCGPCELARTVTPGSLRVERKSKTELVLSGDLDQFFSNNPDEEGATDGKNSYCTKVYCGSSSGPPSLVATKQYKEHAWLMPARAAGYVIAYCGFQTGSFSETSKGECQDNIG